MPHIDVIIMVETGALIALVALFAVWERRRPARPVRTTLEAFDVVAVMNVGLFSFACKLLLTPTDGYAAAPLAELPLSVRIVVALVVIDFSLYWIHRAMHSATLWNTHRFHHSIVNVNWLKGLYASGAHIAMYVTPQILLGYYVFGFSRTQMALAVIIGYFVQLWQHANVSINIGALRYVFVTPQYHRLHHARHPALRDRNFGAVLSVWDVLFGTYAEPGREDYRFGVKDDVPVVRGLIGV